MKKLHYLFPALLFLFLLSGFPAMAANPDVQNYTRAFKLLDQGKAEVVEPFTKKGHNAALNKVILGYYYAAPGNNASFVELSDFINNNPNWPTLRGIISIAEQKIPQDFAPQQVVNWFIAHPPQTHAGFYRYIDALNRGGQTEGIGGLIAQYWVDGDFSQDELAAFASRYNLFLTREAHWARLDRLLWEHDRKNALAMFPYVEEAMRNVAIARLGINEKSRNARALIANVPAAWQADPGLQYEVLRYNVVNKYDDGAIAILNNAPANLVRPELWWEQQHIVIRRLIEAKNYSLAYRLASTHGQTDPKTYIQAEFVAGWLALRYLNMPNDALQHFTVTYQTASTPISRARGAYWMGRAYEVLGDNHAAEQSFEDAAAFNTAYYGQIAATRIFEKPVVKIATEPPLPADVKKAFMKRDEIAAIKELYSIGDKKRAEVFFRAALRNATERAEFVLLMDIAQSIKRADLGIEAAKAAHQRGMLVGYAGYPTLHVPIPKSVDAAFIHALIRQESLFNSDAKSPAGALGLMQLMPSTAKTVARKHGIKYQPRKLQTSSYNVQLGTAFVDDLLKSFDGSYVLTLAAYNAGPGRVRDWMAEFGDPRDPNIDVIDWVERIPIYETRNYVQRIMENLQIYRAKTAGGEAPLLIQKDLKR